MKKSIKLWITISNMFYEVIFFIFAVILLISIQILIVPVVKEEIINIQVISRECVKNLVLFFMYVLFVIALVRWINYTMLDNLELDSSMLTFVHFFKGRRYLYNFFCVLELFNNSTGIRYIYILI